MADCCSLFSQISKIRHIIFTFSGISMLYIHRGGRENIYFALGCTSINRGSCALIFLAVWIVYEVVAKNGEKILWSGEQSRCGWEGRKCGLRIRNEEGRGRWTKLSVYIECAGLPW